MKVVFVRRLSKWGGKYVFTVPKLYVSNALLQPGKTYMITVKEVETKKKETS